MARINKFATQNLNDIYGKKEPKPSPADNGNPAGSRPRVAAHGGMLVLTRPVKQPPVLGKTVGVSSSTSKREGVQVPATPSGNPNGKNENKKEPEVDAAPVSNPGKDKSIAPSADNSKVEESQVISLRPQGRSDVYTPPAPRPSTQPVALPPPKLPIADEIEGPSLSRDRPLQAISYPSPAAIESPQPKEGEDRIEKNAEVTVPEGSSSQQQPAARPQPFRPPQMRGDARVAAMATGAARSEGESALNHHPVARSSHEDPGLGHRDNRHGFHHERLGPESGRYGRDGTLRRYDREERMLRPGSGGNGYYYREGNSRPGPGNGRYDIEVISRPGSGGSDHGRERNHNGSNRGSAYGGRSNFDRQMVSPPYGPDILYREANSGRDSYEYRQDFSRQDGGYRHTSNQFRSGGMNRDLPSREGYGGRGGGFRRETYGRNSAFEARQFRDNVEQISANGRVLDQPREWEGGFGQYSRMNMDAHGGGYRYNDPPPARALNVGYGVDHHSRPRSGGYDGISARPGSGGYGANASGRAMASSDSMMGRPSFYGGRRSPRTQDKMGHEEFGSRSQGRYQFEGSFSRPGEMQSSDLGVQRPKSGGYGGNVGARSMASSDAMMSRPNFYNGHRSPISRDKMNHEEFSGRSRERYQFEGSLSRANEVEGLDFVANRRLENPRDLFKEFDSHRPQQEFYGVEQKLDEECQKMAWDSPMNHNLVNAELFIKPEEKSFVPSEELVIQTNHKLEVEQVFLGEEKGQSVVEEEQRMENAKAKLVELEEQIAKRKAEQERQEKGFEQEMSGKAVEYAVNEESLGESVGQQVEIHGRVEHVTTVREVHGLTNKDLYLEQQDKLVDRFASSKFLASPMPGPGQTDSAFRTRSPNYHRGRDAGYEANSYASRSSSMTWRREPPEIKNGPLRHEEYSGLQSKESVNSERYQVGVVRGEG